MSKGGQDKGAYSAPSILILDAWGTLLRPTARPWGRFRAVGAELGLPVDGESAQAAFAAAQGWLQRLGGLAAVAPAAEDDLWRRFYERVLLEMGIADAGGRMARTLAQRCLYTQWCEPYPEVPATLAALAAWMRLGLATNAHPSILEALARYGLVGYFQATVTAAQVGARKPHPLFYSSILEALATAPGDAIYVDDDEANVAAAERLGMRGWVISRQNGQTSPASGGLRSLDELLELL